MVGRILVEVFRAAVNNKITLVIEEVIQNVRYVVYDLGKLFAIALINAVNFKCTFLIALCEVARTLYFNTVTVEIYGQFWE
jgi:hypothetical protein